MNVNDLEVGQTFTSKLHDDKKPVKRIVTRIVKRNALSTVQTQRQDDKNRREVFDLRHDLKVG